ncbi:molybdenum cofactor guanylyltransferase [Luethyella okanaganae]|uniref:Molybdenum cofactor guanylyltransferase n=1 Tax=Luethyella okanaganae TaxID=69372 RepID=A0ABW1VBX0_9MICO
MSEPASRTSMPSTRRRRVSTKTASQGIDDERQPGIDALILAGGRGSRLDGRGKTGIVVGGRTLLGHALEAASAVHARQVVVVGPDGLVEPPVVNVCEEPALGGPVAGIAAGLPALSAEWVLMLSCDLPRALAAGALLVAAADGIDSDADGLCLVDETGRAQWLAGLYRRAALRAAVDALTRPEGPGVHGASVRSLMESLSIVMVPDPDGVAADVDTWQDLERARQAFP